MVVPFRKMPVAFSLTLACGGFGLTMSTLVCFIVVNDLFFFLFALWCLSLVGGHYANRNFYVLY